MKMDRLLHPLVQKIDSVFPFRTAKAHCDVPCGIYDPAVAQISALTVVRMVDLMEKLEKETTDKGLAYQNTISRHIAEKERHAETVKAEVRIIWGDYIKAKQIEAHPNIHELVHEIMLLGSKVKQNVDREAAVKLVEKLNEFSEIFWQTKGVETKKAVCPYAPSLEMVYPAL